MKLLRKVILGLLLLFIAGVTVALYLYWGVITSNPKGYSTIGEIEVPQGFERIEGEEPGYVNYLRTLPLKKRGAKVHLYTGGDAGWQTLNYAVLDLPLLSNSEQCADACMRLRAEYLFNEKRYSDIRFQNVNGETLRYQGGNSREKLELYLRQVYDMASTYSLSREMKMQKLKDMQPGDVFVYPARKGMKLGHAITVVDVAQNPRTGKKAFLLAEGNTPARDIHIIRNIKNPFRSPWFMLDTDADYMILSLSIFHKDELKQF